MSTATAPTNETTVLHVGGLHYASEKAVIERALGTGRACSPSRLIPVAQTAAVTLARRTIQPSSASLLRYVGSKKKAPKRRATRPAESERVPSLPARPLRARRCTSSLRSRGQQALGRRARKGRAGRPPGCRGSQWRPKPPNSSSRTGAAP